jgi:TetR/AcrR family transcriptional regulator, repressor for neighboring sulfatase
VNLDIDSTPPAGPSRGLDPAERERVLAASTGLFADHGPPSVTLKWVALISETPVELLSAEWPTVEHLLADVLERLSSQMDALERNPGDANTLLGEGEAIDIYQRIVARSLLDGINPAALLTDFPHGETWAAFLQDHVGLDEQTSRQRLCQIVALAWGWRLFGPHIKIACGLPDEPDETFIAGLHGLVGQIVTMPAPPPRPPE